MPKRKDSNFRQVATCATCQHKIKIGIRYNKNGVHSWRCCEAIHICFDGEGHDSDNIFYSASIASPDNSTCDKYNPRGYAQNAK